GLGDADARNNLLKCRIPAQRVEVGLDETGSIELARRAGKFAHEADDIRRQRADVRQSEEAAQLVGADVDLDLDLHVSLPEGWPRQHSCGAARAATCAAATIRRCRRAAFRPRS